MAQEIRRVVTTNDASGKAVVLVDGIAPNRAVRGTGTASTLLWVTDRAPARFSGTRDAADVKIGVPPPPRGSIFRIVDFPPVSADAARADHAQFTREMGLSHGGETGPPPRHPVI